MDRPVTQSNPTNTQTDKAVPKTPAGLIQSVDRALHILGYISQHGSGSVTEVAHALELHKSTASRLLSTLEYHGLVEQEGVRGSYRLGLALLGFASNVVSDIDVIRYARPICKHLCQELQETINLAVLHDGAALNIDQQMGQNAVISVNWVGKRTPLHSTSTGKIFLAYLSDQDKQRFLNRALEAHTPHTITDHGILKQQLTEALQQGYAYTIEELELGLNAVAAAIRDASGDVCAALSIAGPSYRLQAAQVPRLGLIAKQAADEISERLGYRGVALIPSMPHTYQASLVSH